MPHLTTVALELTNVCNLNCWFCPSQNPHMNLPRPKGYMTMQLLNKILADLKRDFNVSEITVALSYGGESLLHPEFAECVRKVAATGFHAIQLYTNGILLDEAKRRVLAENKVTVHVSLHRHKDLEQVKANALALKKQTERVDASILCEEWMHSEVRELKAWADSFYIGGDCGFGITENLHVISRLPNINRHCAAMDAYLAVLWNGETLPCCHMLSNDGFSLGNVERQSVKEIFEGALYNRLRNHDLKAPCDWCQIKS